MKTKFSDSNMVKTLMFFTFGLIPFIVGAQQKSAEEEKLSYYEQRALEDAKYEQNLTLDNVDDEVDFWEDQRNYEQELKKRDKKAYKAYMKSKRDAYMAHREHCDHSCHHSDHYYHHTHFYYSYERTYYPRRTGVRTGVRISTPNVRVGLF